MQSALEYFDKDSNESGDCIVTRPSKLQWVNLIHFNLDV